MDGFLPVTYISVIDFTTKYNNYINIRRTGGDREVSRANMPSEHDLNKIQSIINKLTSLTSSNATATVMGPDYANNPGSRAASLCML